MSRDKPEKRILIVSDSADELRSVGELLSSDLGGYWSTDDDSEALRLFSENHPAVLILAFLEIEKAERFYLTLFRQCSEIQSIPHQTLVLCKNTEAELAYSLCVGGTVDDYVVNRPLYDGFRLRLSVRQALERRSVGQQSNQLNRQLSGVGRDLHRLDEYVGVTLAAGESRHKDTLKAFNEYSRHIGNHLTELERSLSDPSLASAIQVLDRSALSQQFDQVRRKSMEPAARKMENHLRESGVWIKRFSENFNERLKPMREGPYPAPLPEIMVVEDDDAYREMLVVMLEGTGFRVIPVESGEVALAELHRRRPDVVLLDYRMPGLDGIDTLQRFKFDPDLKGVPVIMLTAVSERDIVSKSVRNGAVDFVVKPSDRETILSKILVHIPEDLRKVITETAVSKRNC